jgi:hypothetical protein
MCVGRQLRGSPAPPGGYLTRVTVAEGANANVQCPANTTRLGTNLNEYAGGTFIYLCLWRANAFAGPEINGIGLWKGNSTQSRPATCQPNTSTETWTWVSAILADGSLAPLDVNDGTRSPIRIFMCYRTNPSSGTVTG